MVVSIPAAGGFPFFLKKRLKSPRFSSGGSRLSLPGDRLKCSFTGTAPEPGEYFSTVVLRVRITRRLSVALEPSDWSDWSPNVPFPSFNRAIWYIKDALDFGYLDDTVRNQTGPGLDTKTAYRIGTKSVSESNVIPDDSGHSW